MQMTLPFREVQPGLFINLSLVTTYSIIPERKGRFTVGEEPEWELTGKWRLIVFCSGHEKPIVDLLFDREISAYQAMGVSKTGILR